MYASRPGHNSLSSSVQPICVCLSGGLCVPWVCRVFMSVCVCLPVPRLCLPMMIYVSGPLFVGTGLWPGGVCV